VEVSAAAISDDATTIVLSTLSRIETWRRSGSDQRYELLASIPVEYSGSGGQVAVNPAGTLVGYAGSRRAVVLTADLREWRWDAELEYASDVAFSPGGDLVAFGAWGSGFIVPAPAD
jgi:hypothetical protein